MNDINLQQVYALLGNLQCSKDAKCTKGTLEDLCRAEDSGVEHYLVCLEEDRMCSFCMPFGEGFFCRCPVRVFVGKELKK